MCVPLRYAHRSVRDVEQLDVFIMEMDGSASVSEAAVWPQLWLTVCLMSQKLSVCDPVHKLKLCLSVPDINMFKLPYVGNWVTHSKSAHTVLLNYQSHLVCMAHGYLQYWYDQYVLFRVLIYYVSTGLIKEMDINLSSMLRLDSQPRTTDEIKRIPISCCKHIQGLHMMNLNV